MDETPLQDLKLTSSDFLDELDKRTPCKNCNKSRMYYCYTCFLPLPGTEDQIPKVKLPVKIDVIKHPNEREGKSTAVHAAVIAGDDVKIYTYPVIPEYSKSEKVVLVYPGDNSVSLSDLAAKERLSLSRLSTEKKKSVKDNETDKKLDNLTKETTLTQSAENKCDKNTTETDSETQEKLTLGKRSSKLNAEDGESTSKCLKVDVQPFDRVIFIDSTWNQAKKIYDDERIKSLPQIKLGTHKTIFWRHQKDKPDTYLATVEAIYYFLKEYHELFINAEYDGSYDDLLFFFCFMYKKTRELYEEGKNIKAYKDRESRGVMM